jgi:hypothetical protein
MADAVSDVDYKARVVICGLRRASSPNNPEMHGKMIVASGEWSPHLRSHPLVRQAEAEGWGRDLRQHCIRVVRRQMGCRLPYDDLDSIMPDDKAIKHWREQAERYAKAAKFRAEMIAEYGDYQNFLAQNKAKSANRALPRSIGQIVREMR